MGEEVVVLGGGLAGLTAASVLVEEDYDVTVLEKNTYLGGRASSTKDPETGDPMPIAPHVFVTAYDHLQRFFDTIGAEDAIYWQNDVFNHLVYDGETYTLKHNNLPPPLYLLKLFKDYPLWGWKDGLKSKWFEYRAYVMPQEEIEELDDMTAYEYLVQEHVPDNIIDYFFRYMCKSLLNTPLEQASAAEFINLLQDWMNLDHRKFGFANGGLGHVYTEHARDYIEDRGGTVRTGTAVTEIVIEDDTVKELTVKTSDGEETLAPDTVISTLPPVDLRELLPKDVMQTEFFNHLDAFEGVSYYAVFLWFDDHVTDRKFWSLLNTDDYQPLNTDFYDKSNLPGIEEENSYITSNIIYAEEYEDMTDDDIVEQTLKEIQKAIPDLDAEIVHSHVNRVDYAVYKPLPGTRHHKRPHRTPITNFYLAGDWTIKEVPQCMEAAVRSGYKCTEQFLADGGLDRNLYRPEVR